MIETGKFAPAQTLASQGRPRLGFVGVGWIGRNRLEAVRQSGLAEVVAIFDPAPATPMPPGTERVDTFEELLAQEIDGVVIATPNALHAEQSIAALERGKAVFCQKPLTRTSAECREVLTAARRADRLIGVDFSYRYCRGIQQIRQLIQSGSLGEIYGAELKFHNAYGPDKAWFYNPALSGGGCLLDLGVHLLDLVFWLFPGRESRAVSSQLMSLGKPWLRGAEVEDYAAAQFQLKNGPSVQLVCSWRAPAGCDAVIEATFFGTQGGARFYNLHGSFYDFLAERCYPDRSREMLTDASDQWMHGAILHWVNRVNISPRYLESAETLLRTAEVIDRIYTIR